MIVPMFILAGACFSGVAWGAAESFLPIMPISTRASDASSVDFEEEDIPDEYRSVSPITPLEETESDYYAALVPQIMKEEDPLLLLAVISFYTGRRLSRAVRDYLIGAYQEEGGLLQAKGLAWVLQERDRKEVVEKYLTLDLLLRYKNRFHSDFESLSLYAGGRAQREAFAVCMPDLPEKEAFKTLCEVAEELRYCDDLTAERIALIEEYCVRSRAEVAALLISWQQSTPPPSPERGLEWSWQTIPN